MQIPGAHINLLFDPLLVKPLRSTHFTTIKVRLSRETVLMTNRIRIVLLLSILLAGAGNVFAQQTIPSDGRFIFNVREDVRGLDFISRLKPVTFQFDIRKYERMIMKSDAAYAVFNFGEEKISKVRRTGFIAQDVEEAAKQSGYNFNGVSKPFEKREQYLLNYEALVVPLVKAIQEQQETIRNLQLQVISQEKRLQELQKEVRGREVKDQR